ncbi:hypothetical protein ACQP3C_29995, partial [Escherichia coli]
MDWKSSKKEFIYKNIAVFGMFPCFLQSLKIDNPGTIYKTVSHLPVRLIGSDGEQAELTVKAFS